MDVDEYDELGTVVSRYVCPECDKPLVVEYREHMPAHIFGLACPEGHIGVGVRMRDPARLDEAAETTNPPFCIECQEQILGVDDPPELPDGYVAHPGECAEAHRRDLRLAGELPNDDTPPITDGGVYELQTNEISIVDGVEVDVTVRAPDGDERRADNVLMDLKERLGVLGAAFDAETPPEELNDVSDEYVPLMTVAWERVFEDDDVDDGGDA